MIKHWGHSYRICPKNVCKGTDTVWYYVYGGSEPLGAAVRFNPAGRVNAVFTLGSPAGWRTAQGLLIGQGVSDAQRLYGSNLTWSVCIGYGAMSMRTGKADHLDLHLRRVDLRLRDHIAGHSCLSVTELGARARLVVVRAHENPRFSRACDFATGCE